MITEAERACFTPQLTRLLNRVEAYVGRVSRAWGPELRCHELARAVLLVIYEAEHKIDVIDGHCGPVEHSWLVVGGRGVILDPYAPGRLPAVQLVDPLVGVRLYRPERPRRDIKQEIVDRLVVEMRG